MNIKHQSFLKKKENLSSYATVVTFLRWKRARQQYTKNIQFSNFAVSNSIRMFGQFP